MESKTWLCLILCFILCATMVPFLSGEDSVTPQRQEDLPHPLSIAWSRGPDLPQGLQDSSGGFLQNTLVSVCGFCQGRPDDNQKKPGRYPRGFLRKGWALDMDREADGWRDLPEFPGAPRQGMVSAIVDNALYCWGGFSYSEPYCYTDGYRLTRDGEAWRWDALPALPWPVCGGMCCVVDGCIYLLGGADYNSEKFFTDGDRNGATPRQGARLNVLDIRNPDAGWKALPECPGTPRWVAALAAVKGRIHVIGGATGEPYSTVVDNWSFDPKTSSWTRLRDLPVATGNFPAGEIVFHDRYILLGGGYQYAQIRNPDGGSRPPYGVPHKFQDKGEYYCDMFVYDTATGLFGYADPMPLNNNLSMMTIHNDTVYMLGGETGTALVEGVFYGHHPELLLKGRLSEK